MYTWLVVLTRDLDALCDRVVERQMEWGRGSDMNHSGKCGWDQTLGGIQDERNRVETKAIAYRSRGGKSLLFSTKLPLAADGF